MFLIGTKNTGTQTVLANGIISIGDTYRNFSERSCFRQVFTNTSTGVTIGYSGIYHVHATFTASAPAAGDITVQMLVNGAVVDGAEATETITTPDTEFRTFAIDYYVLANSTTPFIFLPSAISVSFQNTGIDATFTNVVVNIEKEV